MPPLSCLANAKRRSLEAFIERERRLVNLDIADLQDRYGVRTAREVESYIADYPQVALREFLRFVVQQLEDVGE